MSQWDRAESKFFDKVESAYENDDVEQFKKLNQQADIHTNEQLRNASSFGAKNILQEMLKNKNWSDDAKSEAMDAAIENNKRESVQVLKTAQTEQLSDQIQEKSNKPVFNIDSKPNQSPHKKMKQGLTL